MPQNPKNPHLMEIKTSYEHQLVKKEVSSSPLVSPLSLSDGGSEPCNSMASITPNLPNSNSLHHNLLQQQQIQQNILLHQYHQQRQQLADVHEQQLQVHMRYLEEQRQKADEERQRVEEETKEAILKKEKHEHSAVASNEVKQLLQDKILKKLRDVNPNASGIRNWPGGVVSVPDDFPLRKTASEPNISLKVRVKPRMLDRRSSPIVRRKERVIPAYHRRRNLVNSESASVSAPDSGQSSPPNGLGGGNASSSGSTPLPEEGAGSPFAPPPPGGGQGSDLSHPFSSLPNISLGRPPHSAQVEGSKLAMVSETEMMSDSRVGVPITGHPLPSTLPNYPTLPVIEGELCSSPVRTRMGGLSSTPMEVGGAQSPLLAHHGYHMMGAATMLKESQGAQPVRVSVRGGARPLGRTQSAPLPLGHPMLQGGVVPVFGASKGSSQFDMKHEHHPSSNIIKQHIRQAVLKRTGSKSHVVENVQEETEDEEATARLFPSPMQQQMQTRHLMQQASRLQAQVIDLSEGRGMDGLSSMPSSSRHSLYGSDRLSALHSRDHFNFNKHNLHSILLPSGPRSGSHAARPLSRALSSPLVTLPPAHQDGISLTKKSSSPTCITSASSTTGIAFDKCMERHECICGSSDLHPEHGSRIRTAWGALVEAGLAQRCAPLTARRAKLQEIQDCHSEEHTIFFGSVPLSESAGRGLESAARRFQRLPCGGIGIDSDTTWNELHTSAAARTAVGCIIDLTYKVATGELQNGFALVRPPGHHAEYDQAMGFCFFNGVAIAARQLQRNIPDLQRILIIDWDVHHGNGTQAAFYNDRRVLYLSMHRYDDGSFFPGTGAPSEVGEGEGFGLTVNIAWNGGQAAPMGDAEYMAAFRTIVMPIAKEFDPDVILVSSGFDAAEGHPLTLGGYKVSPACFAHMTAGLMSLANGKVILCLEGGYELRSLSECVCACVSVLLGDPPPPISASELSRAPNQHALRTIHSVIAYHSSRWESLRTDAIGAVGVDLTLPTLRQEEQDTVSAFASLTVHHTHRHNHNASSSSISSGGGPGSVLAVDEPSEGEGVNDAAIDEDEDAGEPMDQESSE